MKQAHLKEPFRLLRKLCRPERDEVAIISFDDRVLHVDLGGMTVTIRAVGEWPGQARIPGSFILSVAKLPPTADPLIVRVEEGRFHFGSASVGCVWQPPWAALIQLPMNPKIKMILALRSKYSDEEIQASGWSERMKTAEAYRDHVCETIDKRLSDLGVRPADVRRMIDESVARDD